MVLKNGAERGGGAGRAQNPQGCGGRPDLRGAEVEARAGAGPGVRPAGSPAVRRARYTIPSSNAFSTARVRSRTPSFDRMFDTWFLTVPSATPSEFAISLLL